jgi:AbrB family looped-hinge helix DNA binding protein
MEEITCAVGAKGQVTLPAAVRKALGITGNGRITFAIDSGNVRIKSAQDPLAEIYRSVPALKRPLTLKQMREIAIEEHVQRAARKGL